jgi:LysR family transcriptional regulator, benzoate and cis,cis-muconate-responsive activator of ben and cat genes
VLAQANLAVDRTRAAHAGEMGQLDVAFFGSPIYLAVPVALRAFRRAVPLSEVSLTRMSKREQINAVKDGRIHIGFARYYAPESDIAVEKIAEEQLYIAVPQDIPLASKADVTMAEIADMPLVLFPAGDRPSFADAVLMAFSEIGLTPQVNGTATDSTAALAMVASGKRCCVVPESVAALRFPALRFVPITDCPLRAQIACVYSNKHQAPILQQFLRCLHSISFDPKKLEIRRDTDPVLDLG